MPMDPDKMKQMQQGFNNSMGGSGLYDAWQKLKSMVSPAQASGEQSDQEEEAKKQALQKMIYPPSQE